MAPDPRRPEAPDTGLLAALMTGGLAFDTGLLAALRECIAEQGLEVEAKAHADSIYAGAIGAAIWGALRYQKLARLGQLSTCLREAGASLRRRQEAS